MFTLNAALAVYLHRAPVDFRKGMNGLAALVEQEMCVSPFASAYFVFANRRRDKVKLLFWQSNGFWLCCKRLETDRFVWPRATEAVVKLTAQQLHWLLEGFDLAAMKGHRPLRYQRAS
jgi:transposase